MRKRAILWVIALWLAGEAWLAVQSWECERMPAFARPCRCDDTCTGREAEGL